MKMQTIIVLVSCLMLVSCTKHQREGWEKRAEKITGEENKAQTEQADTLSASNFSLTKERQELIGIETTPVKFQSIENVIELPAEIIPDPNKSVEIRSPISGQLAEVRVNFGSTVKKGEILAVIENPQSPGQKMEVHSPLTGMVAQRNINAGEWVESGNELMDLVDYSSLYGVIRLFPDEQDKVKVGQAVEFATEEETIHSSISLILPSIDVATRTLEARAAIRNEGFKLPVHAFATAKIVIGRKKALVVPASALIHEEAQHSVFVKEDDRFEKRTVEIGIKHNGLAEVLSGLRAGEVVVSQGAYQLKNITFTSKGPEEGEHE